MFFKSNGKILLSAEYLVLDGASSIALPSKLTQELFITKCNEKIIDWQSFDEKNNLWFQEKFILVNEKLNYVGEKNPISEKVLSLLKHILKLKGPDNLMGNKLVNILNFNRQWGLGSSSTFVNNLAKWAKIDPYELLFSTFSGSGFDIACCDYNSPILYRNNDKSIVAKKISFNPNFADKLYLIYLGKKQNTEKSIKKYSEKKFEKINLITKINSINDKIINCKDLKDFENLIELHENIIGKAISMKPIQKSFFNDYNEGKIKSLGSWGGDFILATSKNNDIKYFEKKGFKTIFPLSEIVYLN